jgi:hypothetical protein
MLELLRARFEETIPLHPLMSFGLAVHFLNHCLQKVLECTLPLWQLREGERGSVEACLDEIVDERWVEFR